MIVISEVIQLIEGLRSSLPAKNFKEIEHIKDIMDAIYFSTVLNGR